MYPVPLLRTPLPPMKTKTSTVSCSIIAASRQSPVACNPKVGSKRFKEYVESFYFT